MTTILPFMVRSGPQVHVTEAYVSVPPALTITDETGALWTLGFRTPHEDEVPHGEFAFNVLRNGRETGESASRIERCKNRIRIFTRSGWKWMNSRATDSITTVYAVGARATSDAGPGASVPIEVSVWFERQTERPVVSFFMDRVTGGLEDLNRLPLQCSPGEWLTATVLPVVPVEVVAFLGNKTLRAIPIRR